MLAINWRLNKHKLTNIFYRSRWRLTVAYTTMMFLIFALIIVLSYRGMIWAVSSEQARELSSAVQDVASGESLMMQSHFFPDDLGYRERLFFYAYDTGGELRHFSRAPQRIEEDVLKIIRQGQVPFTDVAVFEQDGDPDKVIMMTAAYVKINGQNVGVVYLGKDINALYKGLTKFSYFLGIVSLIALLLAAMAGYYISGHVMAPMQAAYERQKQFTADASHELRTPLSVVMASADLLSNDPAVQSPLLRQVIDDVKDEVKKMSKLVGDLLIIARSDNNVERLNLQEFDLSASMRQVLRNMQPMADKKNIVIVGNIADAIYWTGDEQKISQLITILVDNAVKYTQAYGTVTVTAELPKSKRLRFSVSDNGIGLDEEDREKIFGRFYRVDKARSRQMGGNGLGLAIAKDIVDVHKGYIYVDSELGKGTTFTVELPLPKIL